MHTGRSYRFPEFLAWTRRKLYGLVAVSSVAVILYQVAGLKWLGIPWTAVALLGTGAAFVVGFQNLQTYNRMWEARLVWGDIAASARGWSVMSRDLVVDPHKVREMVDRQIAWLTAMRYAMREPRPWETAAEARNAEYARRYTVPESREPLEAALARHLPVGELAQVLASRNKPAQVAALQSAATRELYASQRIVVLQFVHLQREIKELLVLQSRSERIKDFPYPRQFATVTTLFVNLFCLFLPFGLLKEFDKLNEGIEGLMKGHMTWLVIPVSVLVSWVFTSLEQVGVGTENPFEGGANDVPLAAICRDAEIDMLEMIGETRRPARASPQNDILL